MLRKIPLLDTSFRRRAFNKKYAVEKALFNNEHVGGGEGTSIIHFSVNKYPPDEPHLSSGVNMA